jgi:hypothetical protein
MQGTKVRISKATLLAISCKLELWSLICRPA